MKNKYRSHPNLSLKNLIQMLEDRVLSKHDIIKILQDGLKYNFNFSSITIYLLNKLKKLIP